MNDYIRRNLESGQRCRQWFIDYASIIPAGSIFETKSTAMTAKVDLLENTAGEQEAAESEGYSATDVKGSERNDLTAAMDPVRTAARGAEFDDFALVGKTFQEGRTPKETIDDITKSVIDTSWELLKAAHGFQHALAKKMELEEYVYR